MKNTVLALFLVILSSFESGCGASSDSKLMKTGGQLEVNETAYNYICFVRKDSESRYAYDAPVLIFTQNPSLNANLVRSDSTYFALIDEKRYELERGAVYLVGKVNSSPRQIGHLVSDPKGNQSRKDLESKLRDFANQNSTGQP